MAEPGNGVGFLPADWPAPETVRAGTTTRHGGASSGPWASLNLGERAGDDRKAVTENRRRLATALRLPAAPAWLHQVHGAVVVDAAQGAGAQADAAVACAPGVVCAVLTADCLPVLFCDRAGTRVAAAHAGWRGLAAGVLAATVAALQTEPDELLAWLGPAIGPRAFEVGQEVCAAFIERCREHALVFQPADRPGQYHCDIYALARTELAAAGVTSVFGGGRCTHAESELFYSYRREAITGRMASLIWL
ncbi:MAG: peptidoglycan editing factor PgeF, partial [Salinisphaera sp.]|nr:peptidoglycan editing factor PgeF [Salinisphaera sp.]